MNPSKLKSVAFAFIPIIVSVSISSLNYEIGMIHGFFGNIAYSYVKGLKDYFLFYLSTTVLYLHKTRLLIDKHKFGYHESWPTLLQKEKIEIFHIVNTVCICTDCEKQTKKVIACLCQCVCFSFYCGNNLICWLSLFIRLHYISYNKNK